jgi:hypothetical protein
MTTCRTCNDTRRDSSGRLCSCTCDDLPSDAFLALRAAFGMLLGEDDFRVLMGNPRGKQMLHSSWLHGSGVVWGMPVSHDGLTVEVGPGLAIDGLGRELRIETDQCVTLDAEWVAAWLASERLGDAGGDVESVADLADRTGTDLVAFDERPEEPAADPYQDADDGQDEDDGPYHDEDDGPYHDKDDEDDEDDEDPYDDEDDEEDEDEGLRTAWVVAEFDSCLTDPVPVLADPCDVSRSHDDWSRVLETARLVITDRPPTRRVPYHRVRVLLGLEPPRRGDEQVIRALHRIAASPPYRRAGVLLRQFHRLAALDVQELTPEPAGVPDCPAQLPVTERHAPVVLARLRFRLPQDDCSGVSDLTVRSDVRTALLPTTTIQDLLCGLAPGLVGQQGPRDAHGPRLIPESVCWYRDAAVSFRLTRPVLWGSWERAIDISSLSPDGRGWRRHEHIDSVRVTEDGRILVNLDGPPAYPLVRLLLRGTGPTVIVGEDPPVPFAGIVGGPAGTRHDGHDAAVNVTLPHRYWEGS